MYKFLVSASLLTTAFAGQYQAMEYGGSKSGSEMQYGGEMSGGEYGQEMGGSQKYEPAVTEKPQEQATPCAQEGAKKTHTVMVGAGGLVYSPESIYAKTGDVVHFKFLAKNHTVTQSTFDKPCVKMQGGEDSDFQPSKATVEDPSSAPSWAYTVKDEKPSWWYCKQKTGNHCGKGMAFAINPTKEKTFEKFKEMAMQQNGTADAGGSGGYAPPPAAGGSYEAPPPAAGGSYEAPPPAEGGQTPPPAMVPGEGQGNGGACSCSCFCGVQSYPSGWGVGSSGGMPGMMPMPGKPEESKPAEGGSYESAPPAEESKPAEGGSYEAPPAEQGSYEAPPAEQGSYEAAPPAEGAY